jgi:hypothetical protein
MTNISSDMTVPNLSVSGDAIIRSQSQDLDGRESPVHIVAHLARPGASGARELFHQAVAESYIGSMTRCKSGSNAGKSAMGAPDSAPTSEETGVLFGKSGECSIPHRLFPGSSL